MTLGELLGVIVSPASPKAPGPPLSPRQNRVRIGTAPRFGSFWMHDWVLFDAWLNWLPHALRMRRNGRRSEVRRCGS